VGVASRASSVAIAAAALAACAPSPPVSGCRTHLAPGDLVITEVFADYKAADGSSGSDAGKEWFEIYDAAGVPIDLEGLAITHSRRDGARPDRHVVGAAQIAAGQFFALGNAAPGATPAYVDYGYGGDLGELYNTGGGMLALTCGDQEIDRASYDDVAAGHARALTAGQPPDYTLNDDPARWCQAAAEFEADNAGTPGADNDCRPVIAGQCTDDGGALRPIAAPAAGQLVISEVLANPANVAGATDATREWFEVTNTGAAAFDLNELVVGRIGAAGAAAGAAVGAVAGAAAGAVIESVRCLSVPPGGAAVLARSADPALDGMLPAVAATFKFGLVDHDGDIQIARDGTVLDAVRWVSVTPGVASQLDAGHLTAADNDAAERFCPATESYGDGTNLGTPGAPNRACP
jgi:hypothetical protein